MKECQLFLPPKLPADTINRERLKKAIRAATRADKWVALCAPGGCGKTIAVAQSMTSGQGTCAWLTVSRTDSDPSIFYGRFFAAAASARGDGTVRSRPMPLETALRELQKLSRSRLKGWIVLDDIHLLEHEVLSALPLLLEKLPENVTPLLLGRTVLPKSFALAQKAGRVRVLDAAELAFTSKEAAALYTSARQKIGRKELDATVHRTGGWAIALHASLLAVLPMEAATVVQGESKPAVKSLNQYIEDTIWPGWDEETQHFLLCCAGAATMTPALCRRLSGKENAMETLLRLTADGAFITQTGPDDYRFHDLFRDFLLKKQEQLLPEQEILHLRELLGSWLETEKDYFGALEEYVYLRDSEGIHRCIDALSRYSANYPVEAEMRFAYSHIIGKLPDDFICQIPHLLATRIFATFLAGDTKDFTHWLDMLNERMHQIVTMHPELLETFGFVYSLDFRVPVSAIAEQIEQALAQLPPVAPDIDKDARVQTVTQNLPFFHRSMRDFSEYHELRKEDLTLLQNSFGVMVGPEYALMERCLAGGILYEQGNFLEALQHTFGARDKLKDDCGGETVLMVQTLTAAVLMALGAREQAWQIYEETTSLLQQRGVEYLETNLRAITTRLRIEEGSLVDARDWLTYFAPDPDVPLPFYQMTRHFTTLSAYIALHNWQEAERFGKELLNLARSYRRPLDELEALVLLTVNARQGKEEEKAEDYACQAIRIAATYGYNRMLKDYWEILAPVLKTIAKGGKALNKKSESFLRKLMDAWETPEKPNLTPQQRRILLDLMDGYSYADIAQHLGIGKGSVKTQINRMYRSLGVNSAKEAIFKAETMGLLEIKD